MTPSGTFFYQVDLIPFLFQELVGMMEHFFSSPGFNFFWHFEDDLLWVAWESFGMPLLFPGNCFLVPRNHFLDPRNHFLVPRNHFLIPRNLVLRFLVNMNGYLVLWFNPGS